MWQAPNVRRKPGQYGQSFMGGATLPEEDQAALGTYIMNSVMNQTGATNPEAPNAPPPQGPPPPPAGPAPPAPVPPGHTDTGSGNKWAGVPVSRVDTPQGIWDAMNAIDEGWHPGANTWIDQYKDLLINSILPSAAGSIGYDKVWSNLQSDMPWYGMKYALDAAKRGYW